MIEFRELSEEEIAALDGERAIVAEEQNEHDRLCAACKADHGDHDWHLLLEDPEADDEPGGPVQLLCTQCPAGMDEVFPDGHDLIYLWINDEEIVTEGRHCSPVALDVPVTVEVLNTSRWTDYGYEYDAELSIEPRGEAREIS